MSRSEAFSEDEESQSQSKRDKRRKTRKSSDKLPVLPSHADSDTDPAVSSAPESAAPPDLPPSICKLTSFTLPRPECIIYQAAATLPNVKNANGLVILTYQLFYFQSKGVQPPFLIHIMWKDITDLEKLHRKNFDKSVKVITRDKSITFSSLKERDTLIFYMGLIRTSNSQSVQTYGFSQKRDDAEVARRINVMKAPTVFEVSLAQKLNAIVTDLRDDSLTEAMLVASGCAEIVISPWAKTGNGISRTVQYVQPLSQNADVSAIHTLMISGRVCTYEILSSFSRVNSGKFMESQMQFHFKEDSDKVNFRGAYILEWLKEIWDKEFVAASVSRANRITYYFLKSKFSGEPFNVASYEGKWSLHQPYVLVILGLIVGIVCVAVFPRDADWYRLMVGMVVLAGLFYL
jgi:hypothetical protein